MKRIVLFLLLASCAYALDGPFGYNTITSDYGPRNISGGSLFHKGIDYGQPEGTSIPSVESGSVYKIWYQQKGGGYIIEILSGQNTWSYMHLMKQCPRSLNTEFCNVTLVDTHNVNTTKSALVLVFWHDKSRYIAEKILSPEERPFYVKYNRKQIRCVDTTYYCITQRNVSAREIIGPVGNTGGQYGYHLHLGLAEHGGQNPLLLIDHNAVAPTLNTSIQQPKDGAMVYRKKYYPIKIGVNNVQNKDLDSVSIQLDNNPPMRYHYGGATTGEDDDVDVVFFDTTGVWPDPGMGNDRFIYCVDLSNDTCASHKIHAVVSTIAGKSITKTISFTVQGGFFVSDHDPKSGKRDVDPFLKTVKLVFSEPVDTGSVNAGSISFKPYLGKPFEKEYHNGNRTVNLVLTDTCQSLRFSSKYEVTLKGDIIHDTAGVKLDGNEDQVPGGDYKFAFYTRKPSFDVRKNTSRNIERNQTINLHGVVENKEKAKLRYVFRHKGLNEYLENGVKMTLNGFSQDTNGTYVREFEIDGKKTDSLDLVTVTATSKARKNSKILHFDVEVCDSIGYLYVTKKCNLSARVVIQEGGGGSGPGGPGRDQGLVILGGDDNWSLSDPHYPSPWMIDDAADVGILLEGFYQASGHLLGRYGIPTVPVESENLALLSNLERTLSDLKVLIVPTGGLRDLRDQPAFWQRLEDYVSGGGYLMVLDQPYGDLYSRLPGSPQGRGWEEDLSCTGYTTKLNDGHPAVSGQKYKVTNYPTDGFFTYLPPETQVHAVRLRRGGAQLLPSPTHTAREEC